ncbi:hypothetical protein BXZ70DRAFT_35830 [Cristinia sonorae]|uniref:Uncharacterized protein n=1 Tax=Cristinia sonorae TaxID=1940300 RepID=A0A8K0XUV4_9AGAR|nr:hypothetical protein BXZ70DRAFT_35830 [Cristinia sonorae]
MDHSLIVPRLRLTRHHPRMKQDTSSTPIPGPSRLYTDDFLAVPDDDNDDSQSTPRLSNHAKLASEKNSPIHQTAPPLTADTPAARLRALLARVPNNTPPASSRTYRPPSPSDLESDFEPVESSSNTPSIARESLKELFSHALRDPGDTPQKGRRRRNSVDASPVVDKTVERERAYNRGKRQSMSDEEAEKIAQIARRGERSSRTSGAAATFDALRERLAQASSSSSSKPPTEDAVSSGSEVPMDVSEDTTTVLKHFTGNVSIPPDATSTPMRSVQMPLMQSQSNLLEQDSEMHRAMRELDSYDEESQSLQQRKLNFPPLREQKGHSTSPARPLSWSSHSKSHSSHNLPLARRVSEEFESSSSRASSNMSASEFQDRRTEAEQERMHERERAWKFPSKTPAAPGTPERPRHQHSHSSPSHPSKPDTPAYSRSRRSSAASMQSFDDGNSSRASSTSSRSEYRSRMKEEEEEKNKERERLWNMPVHARARTTSSLSMNSERSRTNSTPSRSGSAQGYLSPVHITQNHSLTRKLSITSLSGSSRPSSPSHPVEVVKEVVQHIRERNWNSPHPNWKADRRRSISPLPDSPEPAHSTPREVNGSHSRFPLKPRKSFDALSHSHSPHSSPQAKPTPSRDKGKERARADSLTTSHSHKSPSTSASATRTLAAHRQSHAHSPTDRPKSPKPSHPPETAPPPPSSPSKIPNFKARFGWSFPHNQSKPTSEADDAGPLVDNHQPPPRSPSPLRAISLSRIPTSSSSHSVKSPENGQTVQRKKGHKRTSTEFGEAVGRVPPRIQVFEDGELEPVPIVGGECCV